MNELERLNLITQATKIVNETGQKLEVVLDKLLGIKRSITVKLGQDDPIVKRDPDMKI